MHRGGGRIDRALARMYQRAARWTTVLLLLVLAVDVAFFVSNFAGVTPSAELSFVPSVLSLGVIVLRAITTLQARRRRARPAPTPIWPDPAPRPPDGC